VQKGMTVLQAANSIGIDIPTLCNHEILDPVGACRMCVVEIQPGPPRPTASCTTPATDGMEVKTNTDSMQKTRRQTIELLLQHHPLDCPYCDQSGTCELQDETFGQNIWQSPFETVSKAFPEENLNEVIMINHNRCILCYRCVRVCDEQMGVHALDVAERGGRSFIVSAQHKFMDCERCGMCIEVCPVGAVLSRPFKHVARAFQTLTSETTCPHCSVGCSLQLESRKGEVLRARARPVKEPNRGILCNKGFFGWEHVNHPNRIHAPMIRRAGNLVEVGWQEALNHVAERFLAIAELDGADTIGAIGSGNLTVEDNYALQRLMRGSIGTNNLYLGRNGYEVAASTIETALGSEALYNNQDQLLNSDVCLVIGGDINGSHNVLSAHLKSATRKGLTRIIAVTRVDSAIDPFASLSLRIKPGSESTFLTALTSDADEEFENLTGITKEQLSEVQKALEDSTSSSVVWDTGIWTFGREKNIAAAACRMSKKFGSLLFPLPDKANIVGGIKAGMAPNRLPGGCSVSNQHARSLIESKWQTAIPSEPGKPMDDFLASAKAIYIAGEDIISSSNNPAAVRDCLDRASFVVVQETFMNATTEYADVVLPGSTSAEKTGHFVNFEGAELSVKAAIAGIGKAREDWEISARIAAKLGADFGYRKSVGLWDEFTELSQDHSVTPTGAIPTINGRMQIPTVEFPYHLVTETHLFTGQPDLRLGTTMHDLYEAAAEVNELDSHQMGVQDGDRAMIRTEHGEFELPVRVSSVVPRGVVFIADHLSEAPVLTLNHNGPDGMPVGVKKVVVK